MTWYVGSDRGELFIHADHATRDPLFSQKSGSELDMFLAARAPILLAENEILRQQNAELVQALAAARS